MLRRETSGESGFPPWSRRILRSRREIRIPREVSQTPLWYISRSTLRDEKSSESKPGIKEIPVSSGRSGSCMTKLRLAPSVKVRRRQLTMAAPSSADVWRKAYHSGVCEPSRRIRISLRARQIRRDHGGNPDSPEVSPRSTPKAPPIRGILALSKEAIVDE